MSKYRVAALYKFVRLPQFQQWQAPLHAFCQQNGVRGTLLLAAEGINGTIAGPSEGIDAVLNYLQGLPGLNQLDYKLSWASKQPFYRLKVKLKREIVTMGLPEVDPSTMVGEYVEPTHWNALISQANTVLIDVRNDYEVAVGSFEGAINPQTESFTQFPAWVEQQEAKGILSPDKPVAMFCTGGIRCEKSTSFLRAKGYEKVYHLQGGILKYLEAIQPADSRWQGECFVFDERVSVVHGLAEGSYTLCRACRYPLSAADRQSPYYVKGISCAKCYHKHSEEKKRQLAERQKQVELAEQRNQEHVGMQYELKAG